MQRRGYILLDRNIRDWPHWDRKPFSPGQAWIDLLLRAAWKPHKVDFGGRTVHLERGQLVTSQRILAEAWGWSTKRVRRAVAAWSEMDAVQVVKGKNRSNRAGTQLSIVNYDEYQRAPERGGTSSDPEKEPVRNQSGTGEEPREKEGKEGNETKERWSPSHDYVSDWNAIAGRRGWTQLRSLTKNRREKLQIREAEAEWDWPTILAELEVIGDWVDSQYFWSFNWLLKNSDNYVKVTEGQYRARTPQLSAEQFIAEDIVQ